MQLTDSERETSARNYADIEHRKKMRFAETEQAVRDAYAENRQEERYALVFVIVVFGAMIWQRVTPAVSAAAFVGVMLLFAINRVQARVTEVMIRMQTLQELGELLEDELASANEGIERISSRMS